MRRSLLVLALAALSLVLSPAVLAAPAAQEQRPVIAQPEADAVVRGVVQIVGTATHPQFQRYELYYTAWPVASDKSWIFIGPDAHFQQQPLGLLGTWDSRAVPDGAYALRVRVVKADSNYYDSDPRRVVVANVKPPDTPTPQPTSTPAVEPTSEATLPPTPTIVVSLPVTRTATPKPLSAIVQAGQTPSPTPLLDPGSTSSTGGNALQIVDTARLIAVARQSATYTLAAFGALGLFFGAKAILVWLWNRLRP